jgi:hypothetical protein
MEEHSYQLIRQQLPQEWVIREFNRPDYGIDLVVELFENVDADINEALGEYVFVQVKAQQSVTIKKEKIYSVMNVAKGKWQEDRDSFIEIEVVKFVLDTNALLTFQSVGSGIAVLLFLVDLSTENIYFICLNDYLDKVLIPQSPGYADQESVTITIPASNNCKDKQIFLAAMQGYGKRAKMLAAFSTFYYQKNELGYLLGHADYPVITYRHELEKNYPRNFQSIKEQVLFFIERIASLDIWEYKGWPVLGLAAQQLQEVKKMLEDDEAAAAVLDKTIVTWQQLTNLGVMYEEIVREWFQPKMIGIQLSHPSPPEVQTHPPPDTPSQ